MGNKKKRADKQSAQIKNRKKKNTRIKLVFKWTILICALLFAIIFFMMSPLFDVISIEVTGNEKISKDEIISLSKIQIEQNIYKNSKKKIKKNIKENAYIDEVHIKRKVPNKIEINVKERTATYMLEYANSYAYINNQGYILEISEEKLNIPIIMGYETAEENIKTGNRICDKDLEKLASILKVIESANANKLGEYISRIDIKDNKYTLIMEEKKKKVYLGDISKLSDKMRLLNMILQDEEGNEGEIFLNIDLDKQNAFFRKKE